MAKKVEVTYEKGFKSQFVRDLLTKNPRASVKDVNDAWTAAGHEGRLGDTLIYKTKSEIGKSPIPATTPPPGSPGLAATRIELNPEPTRKTGSADIRDLVVEELRQRVKAASMSELIDVLNGLGVSPNERALDPSDNGPF
jgi:hypothetical protein